MIDAYYFIKEFVANNFLNVSYIYVPAIILYRFIFPNANTDFIHKIIKWIFIITAFSYCIELIVAFLNGYIFEDFHFHNRAFGDYFWAYWIMMFMTAIFPLFLLFKKLGKSLWFLFVVSLGMNIGRIIEFFIIFTSNYHIDKT